MTIPPSTLLWFLLKSCPPLRIEKDARVDAITDITSAISSGLVGDTIHDAFCQQFEDLRYVSTKVSGSILSRKIPMDNCAVEINIGVGANVFSGFDFTRALVEKAM